MLSFWVMYWPRPPTPDQNIHHARTHFHEKGGNVSKAGANSQNQEKGVIFQAQISEILKRVDISHVSTCFYPGFRTLDLGRVLKYPFQFRRNEKKRCTQKNVWYN